MPQQDGLTYHLFNLKLRNIAAQLVEDVIVDSSEGESLTVISSKLIDSSTEAIQGTASSEFVELLEQLYQERALISFPSGHSLRLEQHKLYVVCRGLIQLHTLHSDGRETMLGLVGPSMPFGYPLTTVDPYFATALTDVKVLTLSMTEVEASSVLMSGMFFHLTRRLQQAEAWLALFGCRLIADRLRSLLILLAEEFGQVEPRGVRLTIRLSHNQLATIIGSSRVTVTRLLGNFRNEGWLTMHKRQLIVSPRVLNFGISENS